MKLSRSLSKSSMRNRKNLSCRYIEDMFHGLCCNRDVIVIDMILVNNYYLKLKKLIIHESIENLVLFVNLGQLFPKCKKYNSCNHGAI